MRLIWCLVLVASCLLTSTPAQAQTVLLRDDFSGGTFNTSTWNVANYTFGGNRAWFGNTPTLSGGIATLRLDTYNAEHVGNFRGTEIFSNQTFPLGATGVEFEARVRTTMTTRGAVTSFFTYATAPTNASRTRSTTSFSRTRSTAPRRTTKFSPRVGRTGARPVRRSTTAFTTATRTRRCRTWT